MDDWTDRLAGARMQVDQQFQDRVMASRFSNQQWGLIMTAVEWDIHRPEDPESAQLVADTSNLPEIIPELDRVQQQIGGAAGPAGGGGGGSGIAGQFKQFLETLSGGLGGNEEQEQLSDAEALVQEYARELQSYLESQGRWNDIRETAATQRADSE